MSTARRAKITLGDPKKPPRRRRASGAAGSRPWTMIDLFAGCGGMTSGFMATNSFEPVMAVEFNFEAAATYAANFGESHTHFADIADIPDSDIPEADVIIGGPPCQGFSNLGSRDVKDPRNKLWKEYIRFVRHAHPKVFVIENVDRFFSSSEFALLQEEARPGGLLEEYHLEAGFLLAADFGVPQRRKRTIVIGSRIGEIPLPTPTHSRLGVDDLTGWHTTRDVLTGLPAVPPTKELPDSSTLVFGERVRGVFKTPDLHIGRNPTQLSLDRYRHVPPGGGRFDLPDHLLSRCWREKKTGTTDVMGRMRWDMPSLTIRTEFYKPEKGQYLHPQWDRDKPSRSVDRPITHFEAARLQSFPDSFGWCGSKIEIARQIGNAVPPMLAEALARHLDPYLAGTADSTTAPPSLPCRLCDESQTY
ncbi:MAG: DNA cytosine methyltransferase [Rhodococcus sp. (in: high G+C Gram-positive bacteria)]|uniref:DNA cytosine methyltransferase n=1 Tax=Rhodococcus sp. TaxID=1831 RepID=UPI002AD87A1D|nr:DNA cytosine methyltransferase [Rhodococcus sp. (in: high G+C Gram-positive bacteria)]